jgi:D-proline reductase (dithiol) PrdB
MARLDDLGLKDRLFVRTYRWRRIDPVPWTPLARPLAECRLALVSSAALTLAGQEPFDGTVRGGDFSFREIPADADVASLVENHRSQSFDHAGLARDANVAFPLDRVRELAAAGRIGSVNRRHLSFMGSITAPGRLVRRTAPEAARLLAADQVDVALLVPV